MRWLIPIGALAVMALSAYIGLVVASNFGIDVVRPNWLPGAAVLPEHTACQNSQRYRVAQFEFEAAVRMMSRSDYLHANSALNAGIARLGNSYDPSWATLDDTGMNLGLAESLDREGKVQLAVQIRCGVLRSRLDMCGWLRRRNKNYHLGPLPSRCALAGDDKKS